MEEGIVRKGVARVEMTNVKCYLWNLFSHESNEKIIISSSLFKSSICMYKKKLI